MDLGKKLGEMTYDGLITGLTPPVQVQGGKLSKPAEVTTYKRGTLLGKSEAGVLSPYDGTSTPDCILCDDTEAGTSADTFVTVYTAGCFDPEKVTVADGYTLTEADKDKLRERGIVFKAPASAN